MKNIRALKNLNVFPKTFKCVVDGSSVNVEGVEYKVVEVHDERFFVKPDADLYKVQKLGLPSNYFTPYVVGEFENTFITAEAAYVAIAKYKSTQYWRRGAFHKPDGRAIDFGIVSQLYAYTWARV